MKIVHVLTNLLDADRSNTVEVEDEGPFPFDADGVKNERYLSTPPSGGRQRVLAMLRARAVKDAETGIVVPAVDGEPVWRLLSGTAGLHELAPFVPPVPPAVPPVPPDDLPTPMLPAVTTRAPRTTAKMGVR